MRILHIARRFTATAWGGTEAVVAALARAQRASGHDAELLATSAFSRPGRDEVLGVPVRRFGYTYGRFPLSRAGRRALDAKGGNPLSPGLLRALLAAPRPDVLHCHTMQRLAGHVRFAARRLGVPYVVQLHGGAFDVPEAEVREMTAPTRRTLDWGKLPAAMLGSRGFLRDANLVLVLSEAERVRAVTALPGTRVERLPNGVDATRLAGGDRARGRQRLGLAGDAPLLLTVARLDPQKDQLAIVDVLAALPGVHAALAGPVTVPGYDAAVVARAHLLGVADRLHLLGPIAPESAELADLYRAADLFVLPSRHEPFGIVVLEAWACGLAVVASRVGGLAELVASERTGLLVTPGAPAELALAVGKLLRDPARRRELAEAGHSEVTEHYAWSAIGARLEVLYHEISGVPGRRG
ncbi:MAG: glycosyltransferase family 4 protein [Thermoanaerobaculia bacterium]|nr:glycosyltransferase family 4 protein [Thermoanaerobaculia bacterium]MBP9823680.1 glycosyltransferase family 4 protein [Thermoanaerobaculia bacterium]